MRMPRSKRREYPSGAQRSRSPFNSEMPWEGIHSEDSMPRAVKLLLSGDCGNPSCPFHGIGGIESALAGGDTTRRRYPG